MSIPRTKWYTKLYSRFRGVDYSTDATNIADERAADMLNLIADEAGFPAKRRGWRELINFRNTELNNRFPVNGIHYMKFQKGAGMWFLHVGTKLYAVPHLARLRNVLPVNGHMDEEYSASFMPTQAHVDWLEGFVAGTNSATYDWQMNNADGNQDGVADETDVTLLQAVVDSGIAPEQEGTQVTLVTDGMRNAQSVSFEVDGNLYLLDGEHYFVVKREETDGGYYGSYSVDTVEGYIPVVGNHGYYYYDEKNEDDPGTWVHCSLYEEQNYLSTKVINEMAGDGIHKEFWLTTVATSIDKVEVMGADGEYAPVTTYTSAVDGMRTKITFNDAPAQHPDGAGFDNIRVTFTPKNQLDPDVIKKCTIATKYGYFNDNRVFLAGNPDKPNYDYMSGIDDPTYFPEYGWTKIGNEYSAIQGYLHYGDILAIVKEDTNVDPEVYIRSYEVMEDQSIIFPVQQGIKGVGAASRNAFASLRDDALFFAKEGVYAIAGTDASQQRTLQNRSFFVDTKLRQESGKPVACVWKDRYLLCFPDTGHVYVADGKQQTNYGSAAYFYEWYVWDNIYANHFYEIDGELYFSTKDGKFCKFNTDVDDLSQYSDGMTRQADGTFAGGKAIPAYWKTKADFLAGISETKSLGRRGCSLMLKPYEKSSVQAVVEAEGLIVNKTVDVVGEEITSTVFPFERSIKRFSTIQMTFSNDQVDEGFGIYGIQLRYAIDRLVR